ncbi:MAG: GxxExxY protein [Anaerolineales bacterium]|nr:GxxExxY protein [Anaerolineales bacterium]
MANPGYVKDEYPLSEVTARIIAAATRVHRGLGPGFEEVIYQRALELELRAEGLEYSRAIEPVHVVQALSYLKASGYPVGLLLNFGAEKLQIKRLAN